MFIQQVQVYEQVLAIFINIDTFAEAAKDEVYESRQLSQLICFPLIMLLQIKEEYHLD